MKVIKAFAYTSWGSNYQRKRNQEFKTHSYRKAKLPVEDGFVPKYVKVNIIKFMFLYIFVFLEKEF